MDLTEFLAARLDEDEAMAGAGARRVGMPWHAEPQPGTPGGLVIDDLGLVGSTGGRYAAEHIARHDPARVLREVEADRAILDQLDRATRYRDQVFAQPPPRSVSDEMRAVTTMMTLEAVAKLRAAVWSDHPDYDPGWAPA